jgi:ubiquinone/menaquinone biosynthesis C-methylase UbiE
MKEFADHFSRQAASYATFRPRYPDAMIEHLAQLAPRRDVAWDCGTGSGQAAVQLARHFTRVIATDASQGQLAQAQAQPNIEYRQALAESSGLADGSVDCVTVAQALHWFRLDGFYAEVTRVLRPQGLLAVWTYNNPQLGPELDPVLSWFYGERVGRYWPSGREHVEDGYRSLPFPFPEIPSGAWRIEADLAREDFLGYVGTWSAVALCREAESRDPIPELRARFERVWPEASGPRRVMWPISLRVGRHP